MIGMIILALLCLALASVILRVVLFFLGQDDARLARIASITKSIGWCLSSHLSGSAILRCLACC